MMTDFLCFWEFCEGILFRILCVATPFVALFYATRRQRWDIWSDLFVETEVFAETECLDLGFKLRQKFESVSNLCAFSVPWAAFFTLAPVTSRP